MKLHVLPSALPDYTEYNFYLYCERLAHFLYEYNPLGWKTMEDAYVYFSKWIQLDSQLCHSDLPLDEKVLERCFIQLDDPTKLFIIGDKVFDIRPVTSALLSECIVYFKNAMFSAIRHNNVFIYLPKENVLELVKKIEAHFHTKFIEFSSSCSMTIEEKLNEYSNAISAYDFVDIIASVSYQLKHDNQLLLYLHNEVIEMQTKEGAALLEARRSQEQKRLLEHDKEYARTLIERQCQEGSEEDVLLLLLEQRYALHMKRLREIIGLDYYNQVTNILIELVDEQLALRSWW